MVSIALAVLFILGLTAFLAVNSEGAQLWFIIGVVGFFALVVFALFVFAVVLIGLRS